MQISFIKLVESVFEDMGDLARMCCIRSFRSQTTDVICYVKNLRRIINAFVSVIKQTRVLAIAMLCLSKHKKQRSHVWICSTSFVMQQL